MATRSSDDDPPQYMDLDHYCVDMKEKIGQGIFGVVYWGVDKPRARVVAVKECPTKSQSMTNTAVTEMQVLQSVDHPNVLAYSSVVCKAKAFWVVMGFCEMGQIDDYFNKYDPVHECVKVEFMIQIHRALTFMHTRPKKIAHRDIKPANILVGYGENDRRPTIKVADFGLAKIAEETTGSTQVAIFAATSAKGNMAFMAPEMAKEEAYDEGIDLFGAGLLFLAMIQFEKGKPMFPKPDPGCKVLATMGIGQAMAAGVPVKIAGNVSGDSCLVKDVKANIRKMLAPSRKDRIKTEKSLEAMEKIFKEIAGKLPPPPERPATKLPRSIQSLVDEASQRSRPDSASTSSDDSDSEVEADVDDTSVDQLILAALAKQAAERQTAEERQRELARKQQGGDDQAAELIGGLLALHLLGQLMQPDETKGSGFLPEKAHKWSDEWFLIVVGDELRLLSNNIAVVLNNDSNGFFYVYMKHKLITVYSNGNYEEADPQKKEYSEFIQKLQKAHQLLTKDRQMRIVFQNPNPAGAIPFGTWMIRSPEKGKLHIGNKKRSEQNIILEEGLSGLVFISHGTQKKLVIKAGLNIVPVYKMGMQFLNQRGLSQFFK